MSMVSPFQRYLTTTSPIGCLEGGRAKFGFMQVQCRSMVYLNVDCTPEVRQSVF